MSDPKFKVGDRVAYRSNNSNIEWFWLDERKRHIVAQVRDIHLLVWRKEDSWKWRWQARSSTWVMESKREYVAFDCAIRPCQRALSKIAEAFR